jgi:hypothetical protein
MAKKITVIDKPTLNVLADQVNAELVKLGKRLGIAFKAGGGIYSNGVSGSLKIAMVIIAEGQEGKDPQIIKAEDQWQQHAKSLGLKPAWLGKKITFRGERVKILGLLINRKFPVMVQGDGKPFLLMPMTVKDAFAAKKTA